MNANTTQCYSGYGEKPGPVALVYPCSGASDTGEIADRAARRLDIEDVAWMSCLAAVGARQSATMANTAAAPVLLAIDGCPHDCAKKALELAGFTKVKHLRVTDLDFIKGQSPATDENVRLVVAAAAATLLKN